MTATECEAPAPAGGQLTIDYFRPGGLYTAKEVAAFFRRSDQWVRDKIRAGGLVGQKLGAVGQFVIGGESVRVLYGTLKLAEDAAVAQAAPAEPEAKAVKRALGKLAQLNAKKVK